MNPEFLSPVESGLRQVESRMRENTGEHNPDLQAALDAVEELGVDTEDESFLHHIPAVTLGEPVFQRQDTVTFYVSDEGTTSEPTSEIRFLPPRKREGGRVYAHPH